MIVFITTREHGYTFMSLRDGTFGFPAPRVSLATYDDLLCAREVERATYVFADLERLTPFELTIAAQFYRALTAAGLRCLNDPARVMLRVELMAALHAAGINPFSAYRADERPRPARFPAFLRYESDHARPLTGLLADQSELDAALARLRDTGIPLLGIVAIEFCGEPYLDGLWHKWGTFRIGDVVSVDHIAVDDNWLVKYGVWEKLTDSVIADEYDAVGSNRFAGELHRAFDLGGIEFGRADHAIVGGRTVIYEINTNPGILHYVPDPKPLRLQTQQMARLRLGVALARIDTAEEGKIEIGTTPTLEAYRGAEKFTVVVPSRP